MDASNVGSLTIAASSVRAHKYDAGDVVILHGLVQSTHVNGRRAVVHYSSSADAFPGAGAAAAEAGAGGGAANNADDDANNDNNADGGDGDDDNRRCMVRLLPLESGSDSGGGGTGGGFGCISVKAKNLTLDYPPGQRVLLRGLVGAKHLNGRIATVIKFRDGRRANRFLVEVPVHDDDDERGVANRKDLKRPLSLREKLSVVEQMNAELDRKRVQDDNEGREGASVNDIHMENNGDKGGKQAHLDEANDAATPPDLMNATEEQPRFKQILVSPKNVVHLPRTKPPPVPVLDQRLVFTGPMAKMVTLLNQSVHKIMTPNDVLEGNGFGLLSEYPTPLDDAEGAAVMASSARLWGKIQQRSYKCRNGGSNVGEDDDGDDDRILEDEDGGNGRLVPPFYQRIVPTAPNLGRAHMICFNPKCHKIISSISDRRRMKRCTKCRSVAYCDRKCASDAWDHHRRVCRTMRSDDVRFAECVALTSPHREKVMEAQRAVRLCVNRIAGLDDPAEHFRRMNISGRCDDDVSIDDDDKVGSGEGNNNGAATAKLLYDAITRGGAGVADEILLHLENPAPAGKEATVAVGFNSLGRDPVFDEKDVQLFANIYGCAVAYRLLRDSEDGANEWVENMALEPNGEEVQMPNGGVPDDVQEGFLNFLNGLMPGGMGPMNDDDGGGAAAFAVPPGMNDANNDDAAGEEGGAAADPQVLPGMPPEIANFLQHVMNEAGVGVGNGNNGGDDNNGNANGDGENDDDDENVPDDENLPLVEDVADAAENADPAGQQQPRQGGGGGGGGGFHFNFPGGEAHVHMAQINGEGNGEGPGRVPMPPPAFFQMPGMPVNVQVAVAQAGAGFPVPPPGEGDGNGGMGGGFAGAFQPIPGMPGGFHAMHAGPFPMAAAGGGPDGVAQANGIAAAMREAFGMPAEEERMHAGNGEAGDEEAEMEIED